MTTDDRPAVGRRGQPPAARCIAEVNPQGLADVTGNIRSRHAMSLAGTPACRYVLADETGELDLLFLGRVEVAGLEPGRRCRVAGRAAIREDRIVIWNPRYRLFPAGNCVAEPVDVALLVTQIRRSRLWRSRQPTGGGRIPLGR